MKLADIHEAAAPSLTISNIIVHTMVGIRPAQPRTVNRGNGRRFETLARAKSIVDQYEAMIASRKKVPIDDDGSEYGGLADNDQFGGGVTPEQYETAKRQYARSQQIPETADVTDFATHEIEFTGRKWADSQIAHSKDRAGVDLSAVGNNDVIVAFIGAAGPFPRPKGSKIVYHRGQVYGVVTWTDLFGASIKESGLIASRNGHLVMFLREIPNAGKIVKQAIEASPGVRGHLR